MAGLRRPAPWILAAVLLPASVAAPGSEPTGAQQKPPNVLIIVTDDQRLPFERSVMPATHRLFVNGGRTFNRAFVTTPFCCPSRASIMTGRYAHNHRVRNNQNGEPDRLDQSTTVQRYLKEAGYRTALIGKYLNGWDARTPPPHFDRWAMFTRGAPNGYFGLRFNVNGVMRTVGRYSTGFLADRAVGFVRSRASRNAPWFLWVAPYAPHVPSIAEPGYEDAPVPPLRRTPNILERDVSDKPPYVQRAKPTTFKVVKGQRRRELRTLMSVDDLVARVFDALRDTGQMEETLAFFVSDNGRLVGEHRMIGKTVPYTRSVKVPLMMRWPGRIGPGSGDPRLVANVDIAPTIYQAAGIAPLGPVDGRSLLAGSWQRDRLLLESWAAPNSPSPTWASLRGVSFQYVEYYDDQGDLLTIREYYDLDRDPWQLVNLLRDGNAANDPAEVPTLSARLAADRRCAGTEGATACP